MTILPFKRPAPPTEPPRGDDPIAFVTIYDNATYFTDPNRDEVDQRAMGDAMFDSTFHVHRELDGCVLLVMIGAERSDSMRQPNAFDTPGQRAWLRRRLDDLYEQVTGEPRSGIFRRLINSLRGVRP